MDKAVERIIKNRLKNYIEKRQILLEHQLVFRNELEAELQILRVVEAIKEGFQRKDLIRAVFLDVDKAFDRVWKDGLIYKMN